MSLNVPLNQPDISSIPDPAPHDPPAGDWRDDDGQALDSYFEAMPLGPLINRLVDAITPRIENSGRIVRARYILTSAPGANSVQVFPVDVNRTLLVIQVALTNSSGCLVADSPFAVLDGADAAGSRDMGFRVPIGQQLVIPKYTGAVHITSDAATGNNSIVDVMAVTT